VVPVSLLLCHQESFRDAPALRLAVKKRLQCIRIVSGKRSVGMFLGGVGDWKYAGFVEFCLAHFMVVVFNGGRDKRARMIKDCAGSAAKS